MLTPTMREELLDEFSRAIDVWGGEFEVDYETHLYIARRLPSDNW